MSGGDTLLPFPACGGARQIQLACSNTHNNSA